ncbi:hypothetical protein F511_43831 [Dorcoceras hygrometricum]|uniref:Uncharacterized protein n=1 Tax=Dorcoceras hygrometricum TaxID=472368 RepID=A0A2Z7CXQ1_9LAMI|nr:hypothetical protein F511_43831 [Dorcoceras hygrometricum]
MNIATEKRTQRPKIQQRSTADKGDSQPCPIPEVLAGNVGASGDEHGCETQMDNGGLNEIAFVTVQDREEELTGGCPEGETFEITDWLTMTYTGKGIFAPIQIGEINWVTHFLPKIAPSDKGKGKLEDFSSPNPVEEKCQLRGAIPRVLEHKTEHRRQIWKVPLEEIDPQTQSPSLAPGELLDSTPSLGCVNHLFYAYVRKATNTEFNVFVLGRDLILYCL